MAAETAEQISVPLTKTQRRHLSQRIRSGDFRDEGSYIQWLVALDLDRLKRLRDALQEGLDSGYSDRTVEEIFAEAKRRHVEAQA